MYARYKGLLKLIGETDELSLTDKQGLSKELLDSFNGNFRAACEPFVHELIALPPTDAFHMFPELAKQSPDFQPQPEKPSSQQQATPLSTNSLSSSATQSAQSSATNTTAATESSAPSASSGLPESSSKQGVSSFIKDNKEALAAATVFGIPALAFAFYKFKKFFLKPKSRIEKLRERLEAGKISFEGYQAELENLLQQKDEDESPH